MVQQGKKPFPEAPNRRLLLYTGFQVLTAVDMNNSIDWGTHIEFQHPVALISSF
jgi:hypothetical protein